MNRLLSLWIALAAAACATRPPDTTFEEVGRLTSERVAGRLHRRGEAGEDERAREEVLRLLAEPLTPASAVQVALLENHAFQAGYQDLGLARADLIDATTLPNPVLAGSARFPDGPGRADLELSLVEGLVDLLLRPARTSIARTRLEATQLAVAAEVLERIAEVRQAYFTALGAQQAAAVRRLIVEAAETSAELGRRLHEAGNLSDLELVRELDLYEAARVAWARAEAERQEAREELTRLLGLWGTLVDWSLPTSLPELPGDDPPLGELESRAVATRLDLGAAQRETDALAQALGVTRDWRFLGMAELGVSAERDADGGWVTGPEIVLELPLFDRRQAGITRAVAELERADQRVIALAIDIRSQVRAARDRVIAQRRLVEHYRDVVIPLREAVVAQTQLEVNFMLLGAFELIAAKQAEYDAYHEYVEAVRDYWLARSELDRAVGAEVVASPPPAVQEAATTTSPEIESEGHRHDH